MAMTKKERAAYAKAYYEANKEALIARDKAYREANREKIAARKKTYREANKKERAAYQRAWYEANKEARKSYNKAYREANKETLRDLKKVYHEANKEKVLAYRKAYRENNQEKRASYRAKRRALKLKQIPVHLRDCPQEKQRVLQTYKLRNILSKATGVQHHVDHMWPLADGGPHWSGNLQVIPAEENMSKSASVCEETKTTIIKSLYTFDTSAPI